MKPATKTPKNYSWDQSPPVPTEISTVKSKSRKQTDGYSMASTITTKPSVASSKTGSEYTDTSSKQKSNASLSERKMSGSNKSHHIQDEISSTIRKGINKFHNLGAQDPEEYIHPNYWKSINQITEKTTEPAVVKRSLQTMRRRLHRSEEVSLPFIKLTEKESLPIGTTNQLPRVNSTTTRNGYTVSLKARSEVVLEWIHS